MATINPDHIDSAALFGIWPASRPTYGVFETLRGVYDAAVKTESDFKLQAARIREGGRLTEVGVRQELTAWASQQLDALDRVARAALKKAREEQSALATKIRTPAGGSGDAGARAAREIEVRAQMLALPQSERMPAIYAAMEAGEELVVNAVLSAPTFMRSRLCDVFFDEIAARWDELRSPEASSSLKELDAAIQQAESAVKKATNAIASSRGIDLASSPVLERLAAA